MAKSKIIKDLVTDSITLSQALERVLIIAMEIEDEALKKWVHQEKNGYETEDTVPDYRIVKLNPIGTFQLVGMGTIMTCKNKILPTMGCTDNMKETMKNYQIKDGVTAILDSLKSIENGGQAGIPVPPELFYMFEENTNMHLLNASLTINKTDFVRILNATRTRLIEILTMLEKNFGLLDEIDIDVRNYDAIEIEKLRTEMMNIVNGKPSGTTYIISKSKIKGSNIGENNSIEKNSNLEINPSLSITQGEKKSILQKIANWFKKKP